MMSIKFFVFSCLLLVILAHGRTEFHKKDLQLQPNAQEQKSPRFRSVAVQKAKVEPVTMCVLAVAGLLVKAGGLIIQGTHELKMASMSMNFQRFVGRQKGIVNLVGRHMEKLTEDYDHFIKRLGVKLKSESASIASLEMSAAKEIADPLIENFGAHKDIAALQATMEEKSKAFVTNLHTELMVAEGKEVAITAIGAAFAPAGHALVAANLILGVFDFGKAIFQMKGKAKDAQDYEAQLKAAEVDVRAKALAVRTKYCEYLTSRLKTFPEEIAPLKAAFDEGQTKLKDTLMRNMQNSHACFCSGDANNPPKWGKCRWEAEYGWDATSFVVHGAAKTTCEAGWWFGIYAKEDRTLGPTGLTQLDCLKTPGGKPDWGFYLGCRDGGMAQLEDSLYGSSVSSRLPPEYTAVNHNFARFARKLKRFKNTDDFKNCCGGGDSSKCKDDLSPSARAAAEARASK